MNFEKKLFLLMSAASFCVLTTPIYSTQAVKLKSSKGAQTSPKDLPKIGEFNEYQLVAAADCLNYTLAHFADKDANKLSDLIKSLINAEQSLGKSCTNKPKIEKLINQISLSFERFQNHFNKEVNEENKALTPFCTMLKINSPGKDKATALKGKIEENISKLASLEKEKNELGKQISTQQAFLEKNTQLLQEKQDLLKSAQQELVSEKSDRQTQISQLTSQITDLQNQLEAKGKELTQAETEKTDLQTKLETTTKALNEKTQELEGLKTEIDQLTSKITDLEKQVATKEEALTQAGTEKTDLAAKLTTATKSLIKKTQELEDSTKKIEDLTSEITNLQKQVETKEEALTQVNTQITYLQEEKENLVNENTPPRRKREFSK